MNRDALSTRIWDTLEGAFCGAWCNHRGVCGRMRRDATERLADALLPLVAAAEDKARADALREARGGHLPMTALPSPCSLNNGPCTVASHYGPIPWVLGADHAARFIASVAWPNEREENRDSWAPRLLAEPVMLAEESRRARALLEGAVEACRADTLAASPSADEGIRS